MATTIEIISEEIIKPSSETPHHLKNLKLSVLDRLQSPAHGGVIFFYQGNELNGLTCSDTHRAQISEKLKRSLSDTLTAFYPLAGKLDQESFTVDCNDAGAKYVEVRVHARLSDTIKDPTTEELKSYLPMVSTTGEGFLLALQINFFDCGGIAIGSCLLHQISDGMSAMSFMKSWSETCLQGELTKAPHPSFDLADHFPINDMLKTNISKSSLIVPKEVLVTKRFLFDKEKLAALTKEATKSSNALKNPTRVELVSSFIWKHFIEVAMSKNLSLTAASHAVNLRKRTDPPHYLEHVFGNCFVNQIALFDHNRGIPELSDLVLELRNRVRAINNEYIGKTQRQEEGGYLSEFGKAFGLLAKGGLAYCGFSSWCGFPMYDMDYGWGKPVWIGTTAFSRLNLTILIDTRSGDGVEAWVTTLPDDVNAIESKVGGLFSAIAEQGETTQE